MEKSKPKVIWIINHYTTIPLKDGAGNRHFMLADGLQREGWNPILFLASTKHPSGEQHLAKRTARLVGEDRGINFVMLKTNGYKSGWQRLFNMIGFSSGLLLPTNLRKVARPDVVMGCTVHLLAALSALVLARRFRVPFVFEVRDIWPETLVDLGKLSGTGIAARVMSALSKYLYKHADLVVSPLPGVREQLDELGFSDTPFCWVANGIEEAPPEPDELSDDPDTFTFMYLGSHGNANGIKGMLIAFDRAVSDSKGKKKLKLRLVGDGPLKSELEQFAQSLPSNESIQFEDRISRADVITRAREADSLLVNIENLPVYRFGISLNKLFDYMAAGRPTVIATNAKNNPIMESKSGISVDAGDESALANAILVMSELPVEDRSIMGTNGASYVRHNYSAKALVERLINGLAVIDKDASSGSSQKIDISDQTPNK